MATIQSTLEFQDKMSAQISKITKTLEEVSKSTEIARQNMEDMTFAYGAGSKEAMTATIAWSKNKSQMDSLSKTLEMTKQEQEELNRAERQAALEATFSAQKIKLFGHEIDISKQGIINMIAKLKEATKSFSVFSFSLGTIIANFSMRAIDGFKNAIRQGIQTASDLAEVQNVVDVAFGNSSKVIDEWSKNTLEKFGLNELSAKRYVGTMGAMLNSNGITGDAMLEMSTKIAELSGDMASFYNLDSEEAFSKIRAGISGVIMPLKQLGIDMSEANLSAFAMAQGLNVAYNKMSESSKMILRYQYLLNVTKNAQGDFERTQDSFANQQKLLGKNWANLTAALANLFIPALAKGMQVVNYFMKAVVGLIDIIKMLVPAFIGMAAVIITANIPSIIALGKQYVIVGAQAMAAGLKMAAAWLIGLGPIGWITAAVGVLVGALTILINKNKKVAETFWGIVSAIDTALTKFAQWRNRDNAEKVAELQAGLDERIADRTKRIENIGKKEEKQDKVGGGFEWKDLITTSSDGKALKTKNQGDISIKEDDLELLQDIATRDFAQYYQQLTPTLTIPSMVIHETADVNEVIGAVTSSITGFVKSSTYNKDTGSQAILPA